MQRLRISFDRCEGLKFLSHLDLLRLLERAFRRTGIELAYSEGFTPHPKISLAAPLPVGVTSQAELMDVFLSGWESPLTLMNRIRNQLPTGLLVTDVQLVGLDEPSLQSRMRFAEYVVEIETGMQSKEIQSVIESLLTANEIPWQHQRDTGCRYYDLRPLIDDVWLINAQDALCTLGMRLICSTKGAGRPEQVTRALGIVRPPLSTHRTKLTFS